MQQLKVFVEFFRRDTIVHFRRIRSYIINYIVIYPIVWALATGYIMPKVLFGTQASTMGMNLFVGTILAMIFPLAFHLNIDLLFDLENDRHINYKMLMISPQLLILERILFNACVSWLKVATFFPIAKLYLRGFFDVSSTDWGTVLIVLFIGSLFCNAYNVFACCYLKSSLDLSNFWMRWNSPLMTFGGFFIPWFVMYEFSPWLGRLVLLNPLLYVTEGLRGAILGGGHFIPLGYCLLGMIAGTVLFTGLAMKLFKSRVDHI